MIKTEKDFDDAIAKLARYYRAVHDQFTQFAQVAVTEDGVAKLMVGPAPRIVEGITETLAEIEAYTGAAEIRALSKELQEVARNREPREKV